MSGARIALAAACLAVTAGLGAGFVTLGSPRDMRNVTLDRRRLDDLVAIDRRLRARFEDAHVLPDRLPSDLRALREDGSDATRDPSTGVPYRYVRADAHRYRLCATFAAASNAEQTWHAPAPHPAGAACYAGDVRRRRLGDVSVER